MADAYTPSLIAEFKSGISTYLQPWLRTNDALQPLINCFTNRGTINKRAGYSQFGNQLADTTAVMGLMQYIATDGTITLLAVSTTTLYTYSDGSNTFTEATDSPTFSGSNENFFNWVNWRLISPSTPILFMTNGVDNITTWNGTTAAALNALTDSVTGYSITTCLDLKVYHNKMLYIKPTMSTGGVQNQLIYWSADFVYSNINSIPGQGGFLAAPTGDIIIGAELLRDQLFVSFTHSTWIFRYTGIVTDPFRWERVNVSKSNTCSYGLQDYDERFTSLGNTGLIACDGVNVQRYDISYIDFYETYFNQSWATQAFSQRYDNLNQTWLLYVSTDTPNGIVSPNIAPGSDSALIYNFIENSFATYKFPMPLTCLGTYYNPNGTDWADLQLSWQSQANAWNSYEDQKKVPILLAGDIYGNVYKMDDGTTPTDTVFDPNTSTYSQVTIPIDLVTTRWNPSLAIGRRVQFGYIDIYYYIASTDVDNPVIVDLNFYTDNSELISLQRQLTLDGDPNSEYAFKRIYLNLIGEFIQMEIVLNETSENSFIQFVGFILWTRPAGRLTS